MKLSNKKTAYCYLVSNESRDFYLLIPIIYYLEKFENYEVTFEFVWNAHKIRQQRPDLVLLPNSRGLNLYYEIAKYCSDNNILVFNHDSEGNFNTTIDYEFWGYNLSKKIYCPIQFTWNQRVKDFLISKTTIPEDRIKISGAPGFDKYQFLNKVNRRDILSKYNMQHFTKVVGYAGWAFGKLFNAEINDALSNLAKPGEEGIKWMEEQRDFVEECLKEAITKNPDVLFIFKKHPRENFESDYRDSRNEMNRLSEYPNVLYLKDQEEIQDLIQISDLWMAFESTSIMEAWLINIPTLMINNDLHFQRVDLYHGALITSTKEELIIAINELYENSNISYFSPPEISNNRSKIIQNSIGYADGFNHLRCMKYFKPIIDSNNPTPVKSKFNLRFYRLYLLMHIGKYFYIKSIFEKLPKFKKTVWIFENYKLEKVNAQKKSVYKNLDLFYERNDISNKIKSGKLWNEFQ